MPEQSKFEEPTDDEMNKMYGASHASFEDKIVSLTSKDEALALKSEVHSDTNLTDNGRDSLLNDLYQLWEV
jgi:hypothetical protein